jgi:hypothetical protein
MKFWNRKNKIEFFHKEPTIIENFPIIESKDLKLDWVIGARKHFQKTIKESGHAGRPHISRCPGIFDLFKHGYIVSLHKEILIRLSKEKNAFNQFEYHFPEDISSAAGRISKTDILSFNISGVDDFSMNLISKPPWAENFIIKIDTGWNIIAPKGVKFLLLPIAYPDNFDFTSTIGILDPSQATAISFQLFWNSTKPETLMQAGTPLGHLIPLTEKKYQMVQRIMNERDIQWVKKLQNLQASSFSNVRIRKKIINMYNKFWKR